MPDRSNSCAGGMASGKVAGVCASSNRLSMDDSAAATGAAAGATGSSRSKWARSTSFNGSGKGVKPAPRPFTGPAGGSRSRPKSMLASYCASCVVDCGLLSGPGMTIGSLVETGSKSRLSRSKSRGARASRALTEETGSAGARSADGAGRSSGKSMLWPCKSSPAPLLRLTTASSSVSPYRGLVGSSARPSAAACGHSSPWPRVRLYSSLAWSSNARTSLRAE